MSITKLLFSRLSQPPVFPPCVMQLLKGATSQVFLCLGVKILLTSILRAFSYLQNGFVRTPRRNKVNS